jgi:predicted nucleic acid-binding protein
MPILLWDASALVKRYSPEVGSDTVDALFLSSPASQMVATLLTYAEGKQSP